MDLVGNWINFDHDHRQVQLKHCIFLFILELSQASCRKYCKTDYKIELFLNRTFSTDCF